MSIVTEISWDDMWSGKPLPESPARKAYREAVAEIAEKAKATLPDCIGRVDSAVKIVLAGDVELLPDGTAKVASQSNGTTKYFIVNGECSCKDYPKAPSNWCKHRIAAGLAKRARTLTQVKLDQLNSASNGTTQPATDQPQSEPTTTTVEAPVESTPTTPIVETPMQSEPGVATHSEAPASCNTYVTIAGRKVQVTLRDSDEQRLLSRLEALLDRFPVEEEQDLESASIPPAEDWCSIHQVTMKRYSKGGRSWYSHMTANGWCNGKRNGK
jgi:hypothetical protein